MPVATLANDDYNRVTDLFKLLGNQGVLMLEGFLSATTNAAVFRYGDDTPPGTSEAGTPLAVGATAGFGPVTSKDAAWDLRKLWVRNATAGSNATVALNQRAV